MYRLHHLKHGKESLARLSAFALLAHPDCRTSIFKGSSHCMQICFGVSCLGVPVGVIIAGASGVRTIRVHSLYVRPEYRRCGLATKLIKAVLYEAKVADATQLVFEAVPVKEELTALQGLLEKVGCAPLEKTIFHAMALPRNIPAGLWSKRNMMEAPSGYTIEPWTEVSAAEKKEILRRKEKNPSWYPDFVSPFINLLQADLTHSFCLRKNGHVIGWMVCRKVLPNMLNYNSFFVDPAERAGAAGIPMLFLAIKTQIDRGIQWGSLLARHGENSGVETVIPRFVRFERTYYRYRSQTRLSPL